MIAATLDLTQHGHSSEPILFMIWLEVLPYFAVGLGIIALVVTVVMLAVDLSKAK